MCFNPPAIVRALLVFAVSVMSHGYPIATVEAGEAARNRAPAVAHGSSHWPHEGVRRLASGPVSRSKVPVRAQTVEQALRPSYAFAAQPIPEGRLAAMLRWSWRPGCPVPVSDLRLVTLRHWDFEGAVQTGRLIIHRDVVEDVAEIFGQLFDAQFPIQQMRLIDDFEGNDFASIEANNTSAFNCRPSTGSSTVWSRHAYGRAIDLNPIQNPYVSRTGHVAHAASLRYVDRSRRKAGMAVEGSIAVAAFDSRGWGWGGRWKSLKDYQHFSKSGR